MVSSPVLLLAAMIAPRRLKGSGLFGSSPVLNTVKVAAPAGAAHKQKSSSANGPIAVRITLPAQRPGCADELWPDYTLSKMISERNHLQMQ